MDSKTISNYSLDGLEMTIDFLHQTFSPHHSVFYLEKVNLIKDVIDGKIYDPVNKRTLNVIEDKEGRKIKARWLLEWYGLIAKYLFPHENIGDIKEGIMRRGFYEDKLLAGFEKAEAERREKAKKVINLAKRNKEPIEGLRFNV